MLTHPARSVSSFGTLQTPVLIMVLKADYLALEDLREFIVVKYVPSKLPERTIEVTHNAVATNNKTEMVEDQLIPGECNTQQQCPGLTFPFARSTVKRVAVKASRWLVPFASIHSKAIMELTMDTSSFADIDYLPGDTVAILPANSDEDVDFFLQVLQLQHNADVNCSISLNMASAKKSTKLPAHIPPITTPRAILRDCLNLHAVPKKQLLRSLAETCTDDNERNFLCSISSKEGSNHYSSIFLKRGLTLRDLLLNCPSCRPNLALLIEYLPRLLPRPYSIAKSPLRRANEVDIIFSLRMDRPGVTTHMLSKLGQAQLEGRSVDVPLYFREPNKFRYTDEDATTASIIMVGIGTGLAPFLGFLEHREAVLMDKGLLMAPEVGEAWLFTGSATEATMPHRERLLNFQSKRVLTHLFESFSQVPEAPYHYVQEQLKAHASALTALLLKQSNSVVFVCADDGGPISKSIEVAIKECLMSGLSAAEGEAIELLIDLRAKGRYREDLWT